MSGKSRDDETGGGQASQHLTVAQEIARQTLALSKQARAAGLPTLGYLLESCALEASAGAWAGNGHDAPKEPPARA
jgi:hypothetical protein